MQVTHDWIATHPDNPAKDVSARNLNDHRIIMETNENFVTDAEKALIADLPDCPIILYIKALTQSEGNLTLSDNTNWNVSKALIHFIKVVTVSTNWNLVLYPDSNFDENGLFPSMTLSANRNGNMTQHLNLPYWDTTALKKVYLKYTDNAGSATADIYITGVKAK